MKSLPYKSIANRWRNVVLLLIVTVLSASEPLWGQNSFDADSNSTLFFPAYKIELQYIGTGNVIRPLTGIDGLYYDSSQGNTILSLIARGHLQKQFFCKKYWRKQILNAKCYA